MIAALLLLTGTGLLAGLLLVAARQRFEPGTDSLVDLVNAALPQTQCAQCGYPGCRPYAEAITTGEAINRCPPGGADTVKLLADLLGREVTPLDESCGPEPAPRVAVIRESECIGCTLCIAACPVDAIIGARQTMHTVIESVCTGCDLCREPCPVDCIDLIDLAPVTEQLTFKPVELPCINCGACANVCPKSLQPQLLYWFREDTDAAVAHRLDDCIECRRCDVSCPSDLPLTHTFRVTKQRLQTERTEREAARVAEERYLRHEARLREAAQQVLKRPSEQDRQSLLDSIRETP